MAALRRYAFALTASRLEAEDLVQETLMRAIAGARSFQRGGNLRAWLFSIMHNAFVSTMRRRRQVETGGEDELLEVLKSMPASAFERLCQRPLRESGFTQVEVPESIRFELVGRLRENVTAKDLMLHILLHFARPQATLNRVMEFTGPGVSTLSMDERATLANMATECTARSGIVAADEETFRWLAEHRPGVDVARLRARAVEPDADAEYAGGIHVIDLSTLEYVKKLTAES